VVRLLYHGGITVRSLSSCGLSTGSSK